MAPRVVDLEPFDEFETLHYFLKHYYIGVAAKGLQIDSILPEKKFSLNSVGFYRSFWKTTVLNSLSHRSFYGFAEFNGKYYFVGGLGSDAKNANHRKLDNISAKVSKIINSPDIF